MTVYFTVSANSLYSNYTEHTIIDHNKYSQWQCKTLFYSVI